MTEKASQIPTAKIHEIGGHLLGTCDNGDRQAEELGIEVSELHELLETHCEMQICEQCGWWVEVSEMSEEDICEDCRS